LASYQSSCKIYGQFFSHPMLTEICNDGRMVANLWDWRFFQNIRTYSRSLHHAPLISKGEHSNPFSREGTP
jgi:hypothetical protein